MKLSLLNSRIIAFRLNECAVFILKIICSTKFSLYKNIQTSILFIVFYLLVSILYTKPAFSQESIYPTYTFNIQCYNPAYASALNYSETAIHCNFTNTNFKGFPLTLGLMNNLPITKLQSALGLNLQRFSLGLSNEWNYSILWSSYLKLNKDWKLNFGVGIGGKTFSLNGNKLNSSQTGVTSETLRTSSTKFLMDFGLMLSKGDNFYFGFSSKDIFNQNFSINNQQIKEESQFFVYSHYKYNFGKFYGVRPFLFMPIGYKKVQVCNGIVLKLWKVIQIGAGLNSELKNGDFTLINSFTTLAGFENEFLRFVYGIEFNPNTSNSINQAIHGLQFAFKIKKRS